MSETNTSIPPNFLISNDQVMGLIEELGAEHGIEYVATPDDWREVSHNERSPSVARPIDRISDHSILPLSSSIRGQNLDFISFLLFEIQMSLCDAGFKWFDAESPLIFDEDGKVRINRESPIPLSVFLLAADYTLERLSKLMSPEFYDGKAVALDWFARSFSTLQGQPQFALNNSISLSME